MPTHPLEAYLSGCSVTHATGAATDETAYYSVLKALLDAAGGGLKPRVLCVMGLKDQGAGMPDGGLFTPDQFQRKDGEDRLRPGAIQLPSRGVVECKPLKADILKIEKTEQVSDYWQRNNQVLVTNYREFLLVGRDDRGKPVRHEYYRLTESEKEFRKLTAKARAAVPEHGDRLLDFLRRCLRRPAPLTEPKDVAWFLASYARDALGRVEHAKAHQKLQKVRAALEDALGLRVTDAKGERFFQSTLVQTLFYGVFSAWVLWHRSHLGATEKFDWEKASKYLHVPVLRKLFREMTDPEDLDAWENLTEVMNWAADTLNRVVREKFFEKFRDAEAVQYFYEPFLEEFDPELRKALGVWYTPPEVVKYMVARVDQVLRTDFQRPDGLADPEVYVLDPCCGTGAYLTEVLSTIARTLTDKGEDALLGGKLKKAARERIFGFEILPAPFVVAHLQLGLFLQAHGSPLDDKKHERAGVYLTNALTGWQPPTGPKQGLLFPELEEERDKADHVKQKVPILVVIGNPPYNGFAGLAEAEEKGLVEPYRTTNNAPKPQGQGLNDLYVRFFRVAERCITERQAKHGIVCYISNYSWLDGLSHTGMRERFLNEFDQIWIDSLNGDKYKTGKLTPEGLPDPSVFSTPHNREGIQVGTAVTLLARTPKHTAPAAIRFRDFWGEDKREKLVETGQRFSARKYERVEPIQTLGLAFRAMTADASYAKWPLIVDLFLESFPGVKTSRDEDLIDDDKHVLIDRLSTYFDPKASDEEVRLVAPRLVKNASRFDAKTVRSTLIRRGMILENVVRYMYRPFDPRWVYWEPLTKLLDEKRPELFKQVSDENYFLYTTGRTRKDQIEPALVTRALTDLNCMDSGARGIPLYVRHDEQLTIGEVRSGQFRANTSTEAERYLATIRAANVDLFFSCLAVLHSADYRDENFSGLKSDWPRIPLPNLSELLQKSAALGKQIAALLDPENPVDGVTAGKIRPELRLIGKPTKTDRSSFNEAAGDCDVTARWGICGKGGICMPSNGRVVRRPFEDDESAAMGKAGVELLGPDTCDIYLNERAYWKNVPARVWEYTLGGYQVLKKWLSYREKAILGRGLSVEEVGYVQQVARRIAALLLLGPELNENYRWVKAATYPWPG